MNARPPTIGGIEVDPRRNKLMVHLSPARRRRIAAPAATAAVALGLFVTGCTTTSTTNAGTSTTAKSGSTAIAPKPSAANLPGIPVYKVMVKEEAPPTSASASTTAPSSGTGSGPTTTSANTTTSAGHVATTMAGHALPGHRLPEGLSVASDGEHDTTGTAAPGGTAPAHAALSKLTFDAPATMPSGLVMIDLVNNGKQDHQVNFFRPKNPEDVAKVESILAGPNPDLALAVSEFVGGSNTVPAGGEQKSVSSFEPGTYFLGCFIVDADGASHIVHGMYQQVTVTAGAGSTTPGSAPTGSVAPAGASADQAATMKAATVGEIKMKDFLITMPDEFKGKGWYKVTNDEGLQAHETTIVKLNSGKTKQDALDFAANEVPSGPPPFVAVGGFGGLDAKKVGWVYLDLAPGTYLTLCFIPNTVPDPSGPPGPPDLKPHLALGMVTEFTIT